MAKKKEFNELKRKKDYSAIEKDEEAFQKFLKNFVMQTLRRGTYRWPFGHMAGKRAESGERGFKICESCKGTFRSKDVEKDHVEPVIPVTGFKSWDETIARMFVKSTGYQILCIQCHDNKTKIENQMRIFHGQKPLRAKKRKK